MMKVRRSDERGHLNFGWLDTHHTFSFGGYYDPEHVHFRALRVINEDRIAEGAGFPTHPHADMEILTYVVEGAIAHKDSTGSDGVTRAGDVQRMSAGTGIRHSEFNPSQEEKTHLLQIWLLPDGNGHVPGYEQKHFSAEAKRGRLLPIAAPDGDPESADGPVLIHQNARVYASILDAGEEIRHESAPERHQWIQLVRGEVEVGGERLKAGDGLAVSGEESLTIRAAEAGSELLLFDLG